MKRKENLRALYVGEIFSRASDHAAKTSVTCKEPDKVWSGGPASSASYPSIVEVDGSVCL